MDRSVTAKINWVLDNLIPPILRENRYFYGLILYFAVGVSAKKYMSFRERAWYMTDHDVSNFYSSVGSRINRNTDCSRKTLSRIEQILGAKRHQINTVFEYGCGSGALAARVVDKFGVVYVGLDFDVKTAREYIGSKNAKFIESCELGPASTGVYDCIICTHTLEHVRDVRSLFMALREMAQTLLLIVVPLQKNFRYTADLHLHFWRIPADFFMAVGLQDHDNFFYEVIDGDLLLVLEKPY